jgi:hypothetical protein
LSIPAQSWGSDRLSKVVPKTADSEMRDHTYSGEEQALEALQTEGAKQIKTAKNVTQFEGVGADHGEIVSQSGPTAIDNDEDDDNGHEEIVIRRVGFVFLAYNVEYWQVNKTFYESK